VLNPGGKLELQAIEGSQDAEHKIRIREDASFYLHSFSKPVTGVSAMIPIEQAKMKLEDPVLRCIPKPANRKVLGKQDGPLADAYLAPRAIAGGELLAMHVAMEEDGPSDPFEDSLQKVPWVPHNDPDVWRQQLSQIPLQFAPGERWLNDTSMDVLGLPIQRLTGETLRPSCGGTFWNLLGTAGGISGTQPTDPDQAREIRIGGRWTIQYRPGLLEVCQDAAR
jgi:CubicO group peptidase (beta-lactamase class C family)